MESGIYQIHNTVNNNRYVGSAVNIKSRWSKHMGDLRRGTHYNAHLQSAWNKYGEVNFNFMVIEEVEKSELIIREQHYIDCLSPEYNILPIAGSPLGSKHSEETKTKIGTSNKGRIVSPETRYKIGLKSLGRVFTEEVKMKLSNIRKGKKQSPEHVLNRTSKQVGQRRSEETRKKMSEAQYKRWDKQVYK